MARGRPPKPTALKLIQGNAGKRKLNTKEPAPDALSEVPPAPVWLEDRAAAMWEHVAPWLVESRILTDTDLHNLEIFCVAYQRWREAQDDITANGIVVPGVKEGSIIKNPACTVANESLRQVNTFGAALGLDPAARARLRPGEQKKVNPFAAMRGGKSG